WDKEIYRFGEYASRWFIVAGAAAGFFLALAKVDYFWIANAIYLGFVLWAVVGSAIKLVAYRRGRARAAVADPARGPTRTAPRGGLPARVRGGTRAGRQEIAAGG